jgi:hypothetical protein
MSQQEFFNTDRYHRSAFEEVSTLKLPDDRLNQASRVKSTMRLTEEQRKRTPIVWRARSKPSDSIAEDFVVLPHGTTSRMIPRWLIQMVGLVPTKSLGIEVASDVVLGLVRSLDSRPDLDLDLFGGYENGVSRRHAMLRPSRDKLYLIDLHSTNGTRINGSPVEPGIPCPVSNGDLISLGMLNFTLRIAATPDEIERATMRKQ